MIIIRSTLGVYSRQLQCIKAYYVILHQGILHIEQNTAMQGHAWKEAVRLGAFLGPLEDSVIL